MNLQYLERAMFDYGASFNTLPANYRAELVDMAYEQLWKPVIEPAGAAGWEMTDAMVQIVEELGYKVPGYKGKP